ncbi:iron-hydroxamate ABC transporter substrate-binding protein [Paenibacillus sp. F6_3S_P_1C]|uniref:Iron-hydroxamate ABC transporter substrate-binding protein n=1 Tax=Paenibacillus vandeheii TaxID=3035917 RepID=A0ABT8JE42_9BACL|nr:iron-hydroxamate ABC transporter substrate-binding protein [Paenibacillus vandeheii]MDN4603356.1 iron-hydroxamate ABC transporter substrate-binding protein [Paenibacillus vandeheii]
MFKQNKKMIILLITVMIMSIWLAACGSKPAENGTAAGGNNTATETETQTEAPAERTLTDAMGHEVKIPANPERIIASYLEDNLVTLGVKPVAQWSINNGSGLQDYLQGDLNGIPGIASDLPFEAVASFSPDLIIMGSESTVEGEKYEQYNKIAPTYVLGDDINNDWRQALLKIGEILNRSDEAQKALDDYDSKAKEIKEKVTSATGGTETAAALWLFNNKFYVVSNNVSSGEVMYNELGLLEPEVVKEASAKATGNWSEISLEKIAEMDVDYLFLVNSDKGTGAEALKDAVWQSIPAVKNGNVFEFESTSSWLYSGVQANLQIMEDIQNSIVK